jgi:hypothetical protein
MQPAMAQEQMADPDFVAAVERPAYVTDGPIVAVDEAHDNLHTMRGQYRPFADLVAADGFRMVAWTQSFEASELQDIDILVIANARNLDAIMAGDLTQSAFTTTEIRAVIDWVRGGGSLLLIADHAPFGNAAEALGQAFGVSMGKGWAFDRERDGGITTQLDYSHANGQVGEHSILRGRNGEEEVSIVRTFTGQSLGVPLAATALLRFGTDAREAQTPDDLNKEDAASRGSDQGQYGARSVSIAGRAQGLAMTFGEGRVVALGEAGFLTAQVVRYPDGTEMRFGLNVPGTDNQQLVLNIMHWLSGLLD